MKAWLYARASTNKRSQDASPERQLEQLRAYAVRRTWTIAGEGHDRISGAKFDRPELLRMQAAVNAGDVDVVCVQTLSRLGRSVEEILTLVRRFRELRVDLVVLKMMGEIVDTTTAIGRFTFVVLAAVDELQRDLYGELAMEGQSAARARGKHIGRPHERVPDNARRLARELRESGLGWPTISRHLAREGHVQPARALANGQWREERPWSPATLARALGG